MPEPGWYDDPEHSSQLRWWDGERWTERRQPREDVPPPPPRSGGSYGIPLGGSSGDGAASAPSDPWGSPPGMGGGSDWGGGGSGSGASGTPSGWGATPSPGPTTVGTGAAPPRTFVEAIKVCLTKYVDGKGRASRSEYWYFALFHFIVVTVTGGIGEIVLLLPAITVTVRRLHDIGKSAWALLWILLPIVGWILLIVYAVRPGEQRMNQYG
jgi:uncharacterized membrane protein YhaH (DUF805 family)